MPSYDKQRLRKTYSFFRARPIQLVTGDTSVSSGLMSGDNNATYLVLSATGSLSAERVFTPGTGLKATDGGSGGAYTIFADDSVVATLSGSRFSGPVSGSSVLGIQSDFIHVGQAFRTALSGAVRFAHGTPVLMGRASSNGSNVGVVSFGVDGTNITTIGNKAGADHNIQVSTTNTRILDNTTQRALIDANGVTANFTGSHTKLADGRSAFVGGTSINVVSASDGQITFSLADLTSSFVIGTITSSFAMSGSGVATPVVWTAESDTRSMLKSGSRFYLPIGLWNISTMLFTTANQNLGAALRLNGSAVFSRQIVSSTGAGGGGSGAGASTLLFVTGALDYVEVLASGSAGGTINSPSRVAIARVDNGLLSGAGGSVAYLAGLGLLLNSTTFSINNDVVATVTGSRFTGPVTGSLGLSGTLGQFETLQVGTNGAVALAGEFRTPHRFIWNSRNNAGVSDKIVLRNGVLGNDDLEIGDNASGCATRFYTGDSDSATFQHGANAVTQMTSNGLTTFSVTASQGVINQITASLGISGSVTFLEQLRLGTRGAAVAQSGDLRMGSRFSFMARNGAGTSDYNIYNFGLAGTDDWQLGDNNAGVAGTILVGGVNTLSFQFGSTTPHQMSSTTLTSPTGSFFAITGSHTQVTAGTPAFIGGQGITVTSASNGQVTVAQNIKPAIRLEMTASQKIAGTSTTPIVGWHNEIYDTDGMWVSTQPTRITFKTAGYYVLNLSLSITNARTCFFALRQNGTSSFAATNFNQSLSGTFQSLCLSINDRYPFAANDYIEVIGATGVQRVPDMTIDMTTGSNAMMSRFTAYWDGPTS